MCNKNIVTEVLKPEFLKSRIFKQTLQFVYKIHYTDFLQNMDLQTSLIDVWNNKIIVVGQMQILEKSKSQSFVKSLSGF